MKRLEIDITEAIFPLEDLTPEEKKRYELYSLATEEAETIVGTISPVLLAKKTNEIYKTYLQSQNLVYDEERGF